MPAVAAGLLRREAQIDLTIFEQCDTLLPFQLGSDTRWLHPRIYDWPAEGSQSGVAMLPVLNWTAGRASDVAVQVLKEWKNVIDELRETSGSDRIPKLYCNTRHIQISDGSSGGVDIEWVGNRRNVDDATAFKVAELSAGTTEKFEVVILTVGFGLEKDESVSYWRNDITAQPRLDTPHRTFLLSGQGDGAMIDLLRLKISQFRQDRILEEVFRTAPNLLEKIREVYKSNHLKRRADLFRRLNQISSSRFFGQEFESARAAMTQRLRRDVSVVLRLHVKKISDLFDPLISRISFQNKLLVYLLYRCGAFIPSCLPEHLLIAQYGILSCDIIRRHGTLRDAQFKNILSEQLYTELAKRRGSAAPDPLSQRDDVLWPGGYFAYGSVRGGDAKAFWRKEYLPGPTALIATVFCTAVAGLLEQARKKDGRIRVALHRAMFVGQEALLQQCCEYSGSNVEIGVKGSAARTFPARNATIGVAYRTRRIVRSKFGTYPPNLQSTMEKLSLNEASRAMNQQVDFVLAIPFLEPLVENKFTSPSPVAAILYIDGTQECLYVDSPMLQQIVSMCVFLAQSLGAGIKSFDRINNIHMSEMSSKLPAEEDIDSEDAETLELVEGIALPRFPSGFELNYDHTDFVPVLERPVSL